MYRVIDARIWSDTAFRSLSREEKLVFIYLITNSHSHPSGIYTLPIVYGSHDTGLDEKTFRKALKSLEGLDKVRFDEQTETVFVVKMLKYQGMSPKIIQSTRSQLKSLHFSPVIQRFIEQYSEIDWGIDTLSIPQLNPNLNAGRGINTLSIPHPYPIDTLSIPIPDSKSNAGYPIDRGSDRILLESEREILSPTGDKQDTVAARPAKVDVAVEFESGFLEWYELFPRKEGKREAHQSWKKGKLENIKSEVIEGTRKQLPIYEGKELKFIPLPVTFLNQHRWEDAVSTVKPVEPPRDPRRVPIHHTKFKVPASALK